MTQARLTFTAGMAIRRMIRRSLDKHGFDYVEDKGFLDSQFVVHGTADRLADLKKALAHAYQGDDT